jgi:hypothetical protein
MGALKKRASISACSALYSHSAASQALDSVTFIIILSSQKDRQFPARRYSYSGIIF